MCDPLYYSEIANTFFFIKNKMPLYYFTVGQDRIAFSSFNDSYNKCKPSQCLIGSSLMSAES